MNITQHKSNNKVIGAPPGVPIHECGAAPTTIIANGWRTYWKPTAKELELLNTGGLVQLEYQAHSMHPHVLEVVE